MNLQSNSLAALYARVVKEVSQTSLETLVFISENLGKMAKK